MLIFLTENDKLTEGTYFLILNFAQALNHLFYSLDRRKMPILCLITAFIILIFCKLFGKIVLVRVRDGGRACA